MITSAFSSVDEGFEVERLVTRSSYGASQFVRTPQIAATLTCRKLLIPVAQLIDHEFRFSLFKVNISGFIQMTKIDIGRKT